MQDPLKKFLSLDPKGSRVLRELHEALTLKIGKMTENQKLRYGKDYVRPRFIYLIERYLVVSGIIKDRLFYSVSEQLPRKLSGYTGTLADIFVEHMLDQEWAADFWDDVHESLEDFSRKVLEAQRVAATSRLRGRTPGSQERLGGSGNANRRRHSRKSIRRDGSGRIPPESWNRRDT